MKPKVKFCGMTNVTDIFEAENLEVDFLGLIFVSSSPRSITFEDATYVRNEITGAKAIGIFKDMPLDKINKYCTELELDYAQLHGDPDIEKCKNINIPVIQAFRGIPETQVALEFLTVCPYILIDKADDKDKTDIDTIIEFPESIKSKLFLAGGLNPENVKEAVTKVCPFAVDCARGVESEPGKKDFELMKKFISNIPK